MQGGHFALAFRTGLFLCDWRGHPAIYKCSHGFGASDYLMGEDLGAEKILCAISLVRNDSRFGEDGPLCSAQSTNGPVPYLFGGLTGQSEQAAW